ncbi:MAG: phenylalanine--tRNA ligase subunit beta [Candidatus Spechtbacterales bacterium]
MKFSYNWLQSFFGESLPEPEKLAEILTMHSFEVEEVSKKGDDYILDIDILPNRASDCLSYLGIAREIAALTGISNKFLPRGGILNRWTVRKLSNKKNLLKVSADNNLCPRYAAYVIGGIKITDSPEWINKRLASMDQKSINNVVDITNYIMWELGQPLHAFDLGKIEGASMNIRLSKKGEKLETLDGTKHDFGDDAIVIEDSGRIVDLAGIKGGANTQIDGNTKTIIFQAAIFDPARIRRTTQKLGIKTDAATRYMHGFDLALPTQALERAMALLGETNHKAKIVQKIDIYPNPTKPKKITLDVDYANALLGTDLSKKAMEQTLEKLGFVLSSLAKGFRFKDIGSKLEVTVPRYRLDINIAEDVIEEIGRIYGYENIEPASPRGILIAPRRNERVFWRSMARQILTGFGFSEVYNYSMIAGGQGPELQNPMSDEFRYLRTSLWPGVLKNISSNSRYFESMRIFEIGKVFLRDEENISENENCIFAMRDQKGGGEGKGFYTIKGYLDEFLNKLGITDFYYDPALSKEEEDRLSFLHPGRRANIIVDGAKIGFIGEMHPSAYGKYDIEGRAYCAEFDFEKVSAAAEEEHIYQKPSKYPEVVRDIALLVPRGTMVVEVLNAINSVSGPLLRDVDLFDMYEGENIADGMKNLAFHLLFQSYERTLTSQEVDEIMSRIAKAMEEKLWEVR